MKMAYFDCFSGISGNMCLGALISAGVDCDLLKKELARLPVEGYALHQERVKRNGIAATYVFVDLLDMNQPERRLADIQQIIDSSALPEAVKEKSKKVFNRLAVAESVVHDTTPDNIHFHEVGAVDAIIDVVGTILGLHLLGVDRVYASPLPMGKGFINCMHGILPSPAPATLEILRNVPIYGAGIEEELVTPTGAALISVLADAFIDLPALLVEKIGYGAGKTMKEHPNLLRLIVGESHEAGEAGHVPRQSHRHACPHDHEPGSPARYRAGGQHTVPAGGSEHGHEHVPEHGHEQDECPVSAE